MVRGLKSVRTRRDDALSRIGWDRLESLLAEHYRGEGYTVEHVGTGGTGRRFDGGIDLKLRKDEAYVLVQSKHWNAYQVTHNAVHELLGLMVNEGATGAILVTSGEFTAAAIEAAARQGHVQLVDGDGLREMLGPLPEPASPPLQWSQRLQPLVSSAESRRVVPRKANHAARVWLIIAFACCVGFVLLIRALLVRTEATAGAAPEVATRPILPEPTGESPHLLEAPPSVAENRLQDMTLEPRPAPTPAEIRESQRKADEAIRTIEATTPEM